ncbi:MAG TPA: DNA methyltransferase, partial [Gemmatimonadaceae bacterium]|nr:DNA methyltransferase [Gemmatimonadaceae bacterium]
MLTLRAAGRLLTHASDLAGLAAIARLLGCEGEPASLDASLRESIGLAGRGWRAAVAPGPGALRALLMEAPAGSALRDVVSRVARRLAMRSPDALWAVVATERGGAQLVLAAWSMERHPPRVVALSVDRGRVVESDADTLRLLAAASTETPVLVHAAWLELLGRDALSRRFYRALERVVGRVADAAIGVGSATDRRELALLYVSRLLFLSFIEAKGWLDEDRGFLARTLAAASDPAGWHRGVLLPLFFGTLNTPPHRRAARARRFGRIPFLNGGLFARTPLERRCPRLHFPDDALAHVLDELLLRYRFTAREDGATWSDAAIDPEMLGRAFESLMASDDRRRSGAFYTPHRLVVHVTAAALPPALAGSAEEEDAVRRALAGERPHGTGADALRRRLRALRVLDPACGSGAFLVHALEVLADLARTLGDPRAVADVRRELLGRALFGVDLSPMAVWLCELRLWLSAVIECEEPDPLRVPPLPNLDRHVRVGDALLGGDFGDVPRDEPAPRALARLRERYARATGPRKRVLLRLVEREERLAALRRLDRELESAESRRRELVAAARAPDLFGERVPPGRAVARQLAALREQARRLRARRRA